MEVTAQVQKPQSVGELLASKRKQLEMALPKHLSVDRLLRIFMTEVMKNPRLKECTAISLVGAVLQCAQLGLEPGGHLGHAYLVPYRNKRRNCTEAQFQIGYKGMIALARRSGEVSTVVARAVFTNDKFDYAYGINEKIEHVPTRGAPGEFVAVYGIVQFKDGSKQFEVMLKPDVDEFRKCSQSAEDGPWVTDYVAMAKKTVVRQLCKYMPMSPEMQQATTLDELAERGHSQENALLIDASLAAADGEDIPMEAGAPARIQATIPKATGARSEDASQKNAAKPAESRAATDPESFDSAPSGPITAAQPSLFGRKKPSIEELQMQVVELGEKLGIDIQALEKNAETVFKKPASDLSTEELGKFVALLTQEGIEREARQTGRAR